MRKITIEPGGFFAVHSHADRPGTVYVLEGKVAEERGEAVKEYRPGEVWLEKEETTHRIVNNGMTPAVVVAVNILKQPDPPGRGFRAQPPTWGEIESDVDPRFSRSALWRSGEELTRAFIARTSLQAR